MNPSTQDDLILFFFKFAAMAKHGVPLITALETLESESYGDALKRAARSVREGLAAMRPEDDEHLRDSAALAGLLRRHPDLFDETVTTLVAVGEQTRTLDLILGAIPELLLARRCEHWKE